MTTASLSDQFFAASETFHKKRIAYEAKRQDLRELEQELPLHQGLPGTPGTSRIRRRRHLAGLGQHLLSDQKRVRRNCWTYVCNPTGKKPAYFHEVSKAAAFL